MKKARWGDSQVKKGSINAVMDHLEKKMDLHARGLLFSIFADTIKATPRKSGRLANNWFTSIGAVDTSVRSKGGNQSVNNVTEMLNKKFELGDTVYFSNNLPYAMAIEFGHSKKQAPKGMLRISVRNNV